MKKIILGIITLFSISIYSQNRYELLENGKEKFFLTDSISKMAKSKKASIHKFSWKLLFRPKYSLNLGRNKS